MSTRETLSTEETGPEARPPLALIAGPTASGKSDLAVRLALRLRDAGCDAVIVNADSAQVYADLRVLSARPSPDEMHGIPHRLFGTWDGAIACSAADWAAAASLEIARVQAAGAVPILVGGTGLYIRTLLDGIAPIPAIEPAVREAVRALPLAEAYTALLREDPARAAALAPGDTARICRALEVVRSTGRPLADWHEHRTGGIAGTVALRPLVLLPERAALYQGCDERFAAMLDHGAIAEVAALLARDLPTALPVMRAIGVAEIAGYLRGQWSLAECRERGARATRQYAKRQLTWLRHQLPDHWPAIDPQSDNASSLIEALLRLS